MLRSRGINLSDAQVYRLVTGEPQRIGARSLRLRPASRRKARTDHWGCSRRCHTGRREFATGGRWLIMTSGGTPESDVARYTALLDEEYFGRQTVDLTMLSLPKPQWVTTPPLVLGAECDACFSQDEIPATARAYGTEAEIFPDMGHNMMLEPGWAAVAERIHGWLGTRGLRGDDGRSGEQVASQ